MGKKNINWNNIDDFDDILIENFEKTKKPHKGKESKYPEKKNKRKPNPYKDSRR